MKIWHISDTHSSHRLLTIPMGVEMVIFSGDCGTSKDINTNINEVLDFLNWLELLPIKYKIFIAGNHDISIEKNKITKSDFTNRTIFYLENSSITIEGINIWGSPITPTYGEWAFMRNRSKIHKVWDIIPEDTDIIITHGPPKGVLDLSYNKENNRLEFCGCNNLKNRLIKLKKNNKLKLVLFGHIHNCEDIINQGVVKYSDSDVVYSNGSVVKDGKFGVLTSNGNILEI